MSAKFYVLDARSVVGNCALWWRPKGQGYTCELDEAGVYDEAICEFVKCGSCSTVFDVRSSDACPKCGAEPPDPDDDFEPDPDVDDAIAEGFGDGCPFHGDVYADHRANSYHLVQVEKWDRWLGFIRSECAKTAAPKVGFWKRMTGRILG